MKKKNLVEAWYEVIVDDRILEKGRGLFEITDRQLNTKKDHIVIEEEEQKTIIKTSNWTPINN